MDVKFPFTVNNVDSSSRSMRYSEVDTCPMCKHKISPVFISASYDQDHLSSVTSFCKSCHNTFISRYSGSLNSAGSFIADNLVSSEPSYFDKQSFDENICILSSQFVKIYNQALAAENMKLDEIAGMGYRKSLEFLIKDFAIHCHPDDEETIKSAPLSRCINQYIENENIKTLATRSVWLGNDETHYLRKHDDRDINDMKRFITACVYFIGMILITEDASTIDPK